jgi:hypothetical protein
MECDKKCSECSIHKDDRYCLECKIKYDCKQSCRYIKTVLVKQL